MNTNNLDFLILNINTLRNRTLKESKENFYHIKYDSTNYKYLCVMHFIDKLKIIEKCNYALSEYIKEQIIGDITNMLVQSYINVMYESQPIYVDEVKLLNKLNDNEKSAYSLNKILFYMNHRNNFGDITNHLKKLTISDLIKNPFSDILIGSVILIQILTQYYIILEQKIKRIWDINNIRL